MKKFLSTLLVIALVLSTIFAFTACDDEKKSKKDKDDTDQVEVEDEETEEDEETKEDEEKEEEVAEDNDDLTVPGESEDATVDENEEEKEEDNNTVVFPGITTPENDDEPENEIVSNPGNDAENIIGAWKGEIEFGKLMNTVFSSGIVDTSTLPANVSFNAFNDLSIPLVFTFNKAGAYTVAVSENDATKFLEDFKTAFKAFMVEVLEAQAQAYNMTLDELLQSSGMTLDQLVETSLGSMDFSSAVTDLTASGTYRLEDGKLYLTSSTDTEETEEGAEYTLNGDTLTITIAAEQLSIDLVFKRQ